MKHSAAAEDVMERTSLYALGALDPEETAAFEEHLAAGCEVCRNELDSLASITAALSFNIPAASPTQQPRERLKTFLQDATRDEPSILKPSSEAAPLPLLTIRASEGEWRELFEGVFIKQLFMDQERGTVTSLYRMLPGAVVPRHLHEGTEECIVLEGDVRTSDLALRAGDYHCAPKGSTHEMLTSVSGALFLIVAQESASTHATRR